MERETECTAARRPAFAWGALWVVLGLCGPTSCLNAKSDAQNTDGGNTDGGDSSSGEDSDSENVDTDAIDTESATDDDTDEDTIKIEILNKLGQPRYFWLSEDLLCFYEQPTCSRYLEDHWEDFYCHPCWGGCNCAEMDPSEYCDCEGDPYDPVTEVLPGQSYIIKWDGSLIEKDSEFLEVDDVCYWIHPREDGRYRVSMEVFDGYRCVDNDDDDDDTGEDCGPDEDGKINHARPDGESKTYSAELELPFSGDSLVITLE